MPQSEHTFPLTMVALGQQVRLVEIMADHQVTHRLAELGLTPGVELEVIQDAGGPLLLAVRNTRLALRRAIASKILVESI
jgi:ferrous iron transport protein A